VEFAPGTGDTARIVLSYHPARYTAIERDQDLVKVVSSYLYGSNQQCLLGRAEDNDEVVTMYQERRKSKRFDVQKGIYAYVVPEFRKVGALADISIEGMSFKYIKGEKGYEPLTGVVELEILDKEGNCHMRGIPLRPSYDVPHKGPHSLVSAFMRRLGGRFEGISSYQRKQLRRFILQSAV